MFFIVKITTFDEYDELGGSGKDKIFIIKLNDKKKLKDSQSRAKVSS